MKIWRLWALWSTMEEWKDDDVDAYSDSEIYNACDDGEPQSRITNDGEELRRLLAFYLGSQRGILT